MLNTAEGGRAPGCKIIPLADAGTVFLGYIFSPTVGAWIL